MKFKIGDRVKVLVSGYDFNDERDYELGTIQGFDDLGYFIDFDNNKMYNCYYGKERLQKIENNYISKDKIRNKINELTLKNKIPIKDQFVMYDVIKRNFQIEILEELLNEEGDPDAK